VGRKSVVTNLMEKGKRRASTDVRSIAAAASKRGIAFGQSFLLMMQSSGRSRSESFVARVGCVENAMHVHFLFATVGPFAPK
jgi:hypothetical protein